MTLRSRLESLRSRRRPERDPREPIHVLHIGKTGGTALNSVLEEHQSVSRYRPLLRGHEATLEDIPVGERFMFFIRDL